jgi:hypothetical protein
MRDKKIAELALCFRAGFFARERTSDFKLAWKKYKERYIGEEIQSQTDKDSDSKKD